MLTKTSKFNLKTIFLSALLLLMVVCLTACSQVNFVTYHNDDGSIHEYVYITLSDDTLLQNGYNVASAHFEIKHNSYIQAQNLIEDYRSKLYDNYRQGALSNDQYTKLYNGISIIEQDWDNDTYLIGLSFVDNTSYKSYYNLLNGSTYATSNEQVEKLFYTKTYYRGTVGYGDYTIFKTIYNYYANTVFNKISPQNNTLTYSYSVSSRRYHSDADQVKLDTNGNYLHTWIVDAHNPNQEIYFYTLSANRSVWIIACVVVALAICLVLCIIGVFKRKHPPTNHNNLDALDNDSNANSNNLAPTVTENSAQNDNADNNPKNINITEK